MAIYFSNVPATFRNIPKTGTTSFRFWARDNIPRCVILEDDSRVYNMMHLSLEELKSKWLNLGTTFTFVRNPFDRMVSIFHHVGQDAEARMKQRPLGGTKEKFGVKQVELDEISIETDIKILSVYKKGFDYWIQQPEIANSNHSLLSLLYQKDSQIKWLNNVIPDLVIKIENIDTEFKKVQNLLNCTVPFIHVNKSNHDYYKSYYNSTTQKIVADLFKDDLDTFNYDF